MTRKKTLVLKLLRAQHCCSQFGFAARLGVSRQDGHDIEAGWKAHGLASV